MEKRFLKIAEIIILACSLCGCESLSQTFGRSSQTEPIDRASWWDGPRVRPGVALVVQVGTAATQPMVFNLQVDQRGEMTMPLLLQQPVACDGLTLEELKQKLVKAYSTYYRQPQIAVTFAPFDERNGVSPWGTVTVLGEVNNPGPVNMPSTMDLTVTKVLQAAGGLKPFADRTNIRVTRCDKDGQQTRTYVNLKEIGQDGRVDKDMVLRAGDVVWVSETWY